jgi:transcriptional regulator GlxA family with amidase domain
VLDGGHDLLQELTVPMELRPPEPQAFQDLFTELTQSMKKRGAWAYLYRTALLLRLIEPHIKAASPRGERDVAGEQRFTPILKYINEHLGEDVSVSELAGMAGVTPEYFSRRFRARYNQSPKKYLLHKRIQYAQKLMCYSELPVHEVGMRCGFDDPYHFSKTFKRITGVPPLVYRRQAEE